MEAGADLTNEGIVNEVLFEGTLGAGTAVGSLSRIESQVRGTVERAFWDRVEQDLTQEKPEYKHVVGLIGEIRDDLERLAPESWRQGIRASLDLELLTQVLESGSNDYEYLRRLLDYVLDVILRLEAPARNAESLSAHKSLLEELSQAGKEVFPKAVVKGIRLMYERLKVLKQDISSVRLQSLAQVLNTSAGVEYLQNAFTKRYNLSSGADIASKVPRTAQWLRNAIQSMETHQHEVEGLEASVRPTRSASPQSAASFSMHTGGRVNKSIMPNASATRVNEPRMRRQQFNTIDAILRMGLLSIISSAEAASGDTVPESLDLNVLRLRNFQNEFQRIIVVATGLLVLKQELMSKLPSMELEQVMSRGQEGLNLLLNSPTASIWQLGSFLAQLCAEQCKEQYPDVSSCADFMTRVLNRSLLPDDPVFGRVTAAICSSIKMVLLVGDGDEGTALASSVLKKIGAASLLGDVVELARKVDKVASIQVQLHGWWMKQLTSL